MGLRCGTYGENSGDGKGFKSVGIYGTAVWALWGSLGSMGLRCGTYRVLYGDNLWGPMGTYGMIYGDLKCARGCGPIAMG